MTRALLVLRAQNQKQESPLSNNGTTTYTVPGTIISTTVYASESLAEKTANELNASENKAQRVHEDYAGTTTWRVVINEKGLYQVACFDDGDFIGFW